MVQFQDSRVVHPKTGTCHYLKLFTDKQNLHWELKGESSRVIVCHKQYTKI